MLDACLVAHNMRFWCFLSFYSPVCTRAKKNVLDRFACKISDLGSNVCGTVLIWSVFFHFFSLKSMPGVMPVYFSGGHSIWVNVRCYFTSRKDKCGKKNLICMTGAIWSQPHMYMDSIAPLIFLFIFSNVAFFRSPEERCSKIDVFLDVLLHFCPESTRKTFFF